MYQQRTTYKTAILTFLLEYTVSFVQHFKMVDIHIMIIVYYYMRDYN